ncbi:MAG: hypothetical protein ACRDXE_01690, partial [Acidimicrobiales bacterium]
FTVGASGNVVMWYSAGPGGVGSNTALTGWIETDNGAQWAIAQSYSFGGGGGNGGVGYATISNDGQDDIYYTMISGGKTYVAGWPGSSFSFGGSSSVGYATLTAKGATAT